MTTSKQGSKSRKAKPGAPRGKARAKSEAPREASREASDSDQGADAVDSADGDGEGDADGEWGEGEPLDEPVGPDVEDGEVLEATGEVISDEPVENEPESRRFGSSALTKVDALQTYMREVQRHALLSPDEEHSLAVQYAKTGDVN
ncbi:MAG TPA: sigma-70 factor domain-containing protein, partial [Polyangiaceae bacterium]|nr:sigma-70 factor domain-containing protein [Polyangiaceae bacterium]